MKLHQIYELGGEVVFGKDARWQSFQNAWFDNIIDLRYSERELDEEALAAEGRLVATEIVYMNGDDDYSSKVTMLAFDGKPFALEGSGGDGHEQKYLLVTDEPTYFEAEAHVRDFIKERAFKPYDVVSPDEDRSLEELFGFYYQDMADATRVRVKEVFGIEEAKAVLSYESAERAEGYTLVRGSSVLKNPTEEQRKLIIVGCTFTEEPAPYLRRGSVLLQRMQLSEHEQVPGWKELLPEYVQWWEYSPVRSAPADAVISRV